MGFLDAALKNDPKNYHAWSYRQWFVKKHDLWDTELALVESFIEFDVRNNSAWNQRYFVLKHKRTVEVLVQEVQYVTSKIHLAPQNESTWLYLKRYSLMFKFPLLIKIPVFCIC